MRLILEEFGIRPADVTWVRRSYNDPGQVEKITLDLPAGVWLENAPEGATISGMLASGELDAVIGPCALAPLREGHPHVG